MEMREDGVVVVGREDLATGNENCPAAKVQLNMLRDNRMLYTARKVLFLEGGINTVLKDAEAEAAAREPEETPVSETERIACETLVRLASLVQRVLLWVEDQEDVPEEVMTLTAESIDLITQVLPGEPDGQTSEVRDQGQLYGESAEDGGLKTEE